MSKLFINFSENIILQILLKSLSITFCKDFHLEIFNFFSTIHLLFNSYKVNKYDKQQD